MHFYTSLIFTSCSRGESKVMIFSVSWQILKRMKFPLTTLLINFSRLFEHCLNYFAITGNNWHDKKCIIYYYVHCRRFFIIIIDGKWIFKNNDIAVNRKWKIISSITYEYGWCLWIVINLLHSFTSHADYVTVIIIILCHLKFSYWFPITSVYWLRY